MRVLFKQIAATESNDDRFLYGLTANGFVYQYSFRAEKWYPLEMEAESGEDLDVAPSSTIP